MDGPVGIGERVRRDAFTDAWSDREAELRRSPEKVTPTGTAVRYGQSARSVDAVVGAADVVQRISAEAERLLRSRPAALVRD